LYFDINLLDARKAIPANQFCHGLNKQGVDNVNTSTSRNRGGLIYLSDSILTDLKMEKGYQDARCIQTPQIM
jgi:hypothetical protein